VLCTVPVEYSEFNMRLDSYSSLTHIRKFLHFSSLLYANLGNLFKKITSTKYFISV
jgi:hypothetical protein